MEKYKQNKIKFFVVKRGRKPGIYNTWEECKLQTDKFKDNLFKSFKTLSEAQNYFYDGKPPKNLKGPMDKFIAPKRIKDLELTEAEIKQVLALLDKK